MSRSVEKRCRSRNGVRAVVARGGQAFENDQRIARFCMGQTGADNASEEEIAQRLWQRSELRAALRDLLDIYDRHVHGKEGPNGRSGSWGVDEVQRLNQIRELAK